MFVPSSPDPEIRYAGKVASAMSLGPTEPRPPAPPPPTPPPPGRGVGMSSSGILGRSCAWLVAGRAMTEDVAARARIIEEIVEVFIVGS